LIELDGNTVAVNYVRKFKEPGVTEHEPTRDMAVQDHSVTDT